MTPGRIEVRNHMVEIVDGTPSEGIGQLGPYAVIWDIESELIVADPLSRYTGGYGERTWEVRRDRKTGHTRWIPLGRDDV
jgi:hypothetical protein